MTRAGNVERLLAHWRADGHVRLGPPTTEAELNSFERKYSVQLPLVMRAYLEQVNGFMPPDNQDREGFSFWPLRQITRVSDFRNCRYGARSELYLFADYLDWSWAYAVTLVGPMSSVFIVGTADGEPQMVSTSIDEFIELYLVDDPRIYVR